MNQEGALIEFASDELRDDKEVILEAIHNNPEALEFASDRLKADREVVYESVSKVGWTYCYARGNLLDDKDAPVDKGLEVFKKLYGTKIRY